MHQTKKVSVIAAAAFCCFISVGCSSDNSTADDQTTVENNSKSKTGLDPSLFVADALTKIPELVDCTLSDGTETKCYEIVTMGTPAGQKVGPFCPPKTTSTADEAGIWIDGEGTVFDLSGEWISNLATHYNDAKWDLTDGDNIKITDTQESCEGAAKPNVEEQYQNHCVECSLDYVDGGISVTFLIPATPEPADSPADMLPQVGVSLNGIELSGPAPLEAILTNYTIAAFDDCGGHINVNQGYHYHAATDCAEVGDKIDGHAGLIGYVLDGYGIYGMKDTSGNESDDLDNCRGHSDDLRGYHYHAAGAGENMFIGCFHGKTVQTSNTDGPGGGGPPPGGGPGDD